MKKHAGIRARLAAEELADRLDLDAPESRFRRLAPAMVFTASLLVGLTTSEPKALAQVSTPPGSPYSYAPPPSPITTPQQAYDYGYENGSIDKDEGIYGGYGLLTGFVAPAFWDAYTQGYWAGRFGLPSNPPADPGDDPGDEDDDGCGGPGCGGPGCGSPSCGSPGCGAPGCGGGASGGCGG
jgi:hypothetical protein